jgi:BirA family transcriptional regulator, biotin operon repressor / biotin---[acetyl-CoA-carboxylase] ligase
MSIELPEQWDTDRIVAETFSAAVEVHETLPSTNDRALRLAAALETPLPHLVLADRQTRGRGRGQNRWWSSAGSLTFSLLLELDAQRLPMSRWPEVSLTVGSSICRAVSDLLPGEQLGLKWPNDVYLRGAKLSGVLVEVPPGTAGRVVVGVGLNVANSLAHAPPDVQQRAIALCDVGGPTSRQEVLIAVLRHIERQLQLLVDDPQTVRQCWRGYDLLMGSSVTLSDGITDVSGTAVGIDDDGALLLRTEAGTRRCYSGVVRSFG